MLDSRPAQDHRDVLHYCRTCDEQFASTDHESAHRSALTHVRQTHAPDRPYERCSRNCELVAQPEERRTNRKLYGVGVQTPPPSETSRRAYRELFGEDA